jgi:hypothetical protein
VRQIERRLLAISDAYPRDSTSRHRPGAAVLSLLGARAHSMYRGFIHALSGPSAPLQIIAVRPLVELAIFMKWFTLDPAVHVQLWTAQSEQNDLRVIREVGECLTLTNPLPEPWRADQLALKTEIVAEAKEQLKQTGRDYGRRLTPSLARMVEEVGASAPGHAIPLWQAYSLAYRFVSPWDHTEASSFKASTERVSSSKLLFVGDKLPMRRRDLRLLAAAMFAYCIEIVSEFTGPWWREGRATRGLASSCSHRRGEGSRRARAAASDGLKAGQAIAGTRRVRRAAANPNQSQAAGRGTLNQPE